MTDRERAWADLGIEYAEGIDRCALIVLPTGREVRRTPRGTWEAQPPRDNTWREFDDALRAAQFALGFDPGP